MEHSDGGRAETSAPKQDPGQRQRDTYRRGSCSHRPQHDRLTVIGASQAVAVENLSVKGLARTRLAKSVQDTGWSGFLNMLEYKASRAGREFIKIGRFEPTSQVCAPCGIKDGPKPLSVRMRIWTCGDCGAVHDRGVNAARNIAKVAGPAVSACGAWARPGLVPAPRREA